MPSNLSVWLAGSHCLWESQGGQNTLLGSGTFITRSCYSLCAKCTKACNHICRHSAHLPADKGMKETGCPEHRLVPLEASAGQQQGGFPSYVSLLPSLFKSEDWETLRKSSCWCAVLLGNSHLLVASSMLPALKGLRIFICFQGPKCTMSHRVLPQMKVCMCKGRREGRLGV